MILVQFQAHFALAVSHSEWEHIRGGIEGGVDAVATDDSKEGGGGSGQSAEPWVDPAEEADTEERVRREHALTPQSAGRMRIRSEESLLFSI